MKYDDITMKMDLHKIGPRKKAMYKDYQKGKRIWELEQCFNEAIKEGDDYQAHYYDYQITKLYKQIGINEA